MNNKKHPLMVAMRFFARTDVFVYALLWLIFLLVLGTLAQKELGLYLAQEKYFASYVFWLGDFLPLPGGVPTMALIFFSMLFKLFFDKWTLRKTGTFVAHTGALLLLFGGFLTAAFSYEGSMVIPEGGSSNYLADYHTIELAISTKTGEVIFSEDELKGKAELKNSKLPFVIMPQNFYRNIELNKREKTADGKALKGGANMFEISPEKLKKEHEQNIAGLNFTIEGEAQAAGFYTVFENMPVVQHVRLGAEKYKVELRNKRTYLPFSIKLVDFKKQVYPGSGMAKSYSSKVVVKDADLEWLSLIEMNSPLRYKGYTFYQASFGQNGKEETTVLAVVKNVGRSFPYIASIIMCIGLLIQLFKRMPILLKRGKK